MCKLAFDQNGAASMLPGPFDRIGQFASSRCLQPQAATISCIEHIHQASVIPLLVVVVRAVVDHRFGDITMIVKQKDRDVVQLLANHSRNTLGSESEGAIPNHGNDAPT